MDVLGQRPSKPICDRGAQGRWSRSGGPAGPFTGTNRLAPDSDIHELPVVANAAQVVKRVHPVEVQMPVEVVEFVL